MNVSKYLIARKNSLLIKINDQCFIDQIMCTKFLVALTIAIIEQTIRNLKISIKEHNTRLSKNDADESKYLTKNPDHWTDFNIGNIFTRFDK